MNPVQRHIDQLLAVHDPTWDNRQGLADALIAIAGDIEPRASLIAGRPVSDTTKAAARGILKSAAALRAIAERLESE